MLQLSPAEAHYFLYTKDKIIFEERKHDYELMRLQTFYLLMPHSKKGKDSLKKPEDIFTFAWEKNKVVKIDPSQFSEAAFQEADRKYARLKVS